MENLRTKDLIFVFICLAIIPAIFVITGGDNFLYSAKSEYSDLVISHYPNLIYLKESLAKWGVIPLWSNAILSGYPFAGDPLSGLWYPFTWLLILLPLPFGFNLVTSIHILLGGIGIYLSLKKMGVKKFGAIVGALSFELMPKLLAHYAAGHLTLVFAVCLTPWIIFCEKQYEMKPTTVNCYATGFILGLIACADIRWMPYAGLLFMIMRIATIIKINLLSFYSYKMKRFFLFNLHLLFSNFILPFLSAMGLSAGVWLPLVQFSLLSTRSLMTVADRLAFSLPPKNLLGLMFPDIHGYCEWILYPGALALISIVFLTTSKISWKKSRGCIFLLLGSLLWALGSNNPFMQYLSAIPGFGLLRVPARSLFIAGISFSLLTGIFLNDFLFSRHIGKWGKMITFSLCIFSTSLCLGVKFISGKWDLEFVWGSVALLLFWLLLILFSEKKQISEKIVFACLSLFLVLDLGFIDTNNFEIRPKEAVMQEKTSLGAWLADQPGKFRIYSPSYSIPQLTAIQYGLELADGIDPLQLHVYDTFMHAATGVPGMEYSVTQPRFSTGNPAIDNQKFIPSAQLLGILNIRYVCTEFPLEVNGLILVNKIENTRIYENIYMHPRIWMQNNSSLTEEIIELSPDQLEAEQFLPNRIELRTNTEEGILVLSEILYPGWKVFVDGKKRNLVSIGGLLRGVKLSAGQHIIIFTFKPILEYSGLMISLLTLISFGIFIALKRKRLDKNA